MEQEELDNHAVISSYNVQENAAPSSCNKIPPSTGISIFNNDVSRSSDEPNKSKSHEYICSP